MKILLTILFVLTIRTCFGQAGNSCDSIFSKPQVPAEFAGGIKGLADYFNKKLVPVLSECMRQEGGVIAGVYIVMTIDQTGRVIGVDFPEFQAGENCKEVLKNQIVTMKGWSAGQMNGENVCSEFYWPISCLKWG